MSDDHDISFRRVHFRTMLLTYVDCQGNVEAYFEQSAVPEYDWIGDEPSFGVNAERLAIILPRIQQWAKSEGLVLKVWRDDELGI